MITPRQSTLLDLVQAINAFATSDAEVVATVAYLINSGKVVLCGNFAGAKIDLSTPAGATLEERPLQAAGWRLSPLRCHTASNTDSPFIQYIEHATVHPSTSLTRSLP
jgi:hypothetical protein